MRTFPFHESRSVSKYVCKLFQFPRNALLMSKFNISAPGEMRGKERRGRRSPFGRRGDNYNHRRRRSRSRSHGRDRSPVRGKRRRSRSRSRSKSYERRRSRYVSSHHFKYLVVYGQGFGEYVKLNVFIVLTF